VAERIGNHLRQRRFVKRLLQKEESPQAENPFRTAIHAEMIAFDVTGEPIPHWAVGLDPLPDARSPPDEAYYFIDPPAPDD
jgi:hypothetical protein